MYNLVRNVKQSCFLVHLGFLGFVREHTSEALLNQMTFTNTDLIEKYVDFLRVSVTYSYLY